MFKFAMILFAIAITCFIGPFLLWRDYLEGNWFMLTIDASIIFLWADWLWRKFKQVNR